MEKHHIDVESVAFVKVNSIFASFFFIITASSFFSLPGLARRLLRGPNAWYGSVRGEKGGFEVELGCFGNSSSKTVSELRSCSPCVGLGGGSVILLLCCCSTGEPVGVQRGEFSAEL